MTVKYFIIPLVILLLVRLSCSAQQGATWIYPNAFELDFYDQGSSISFPTFPHTDYYVFPFATIDDVDGKLLIYTDSHDIRDHNGNVFKNGSDLNGVYSIIIPRPGFGSMYYVFTLQNTAPVAPGVIADRIVYAIVDLAANGGEGEVILRDQILYSDLHGSFTIWGSCGGSLYWLAGEANRNLTVVGTDQIFVFKIDSTGIHQTDAYAPDEGIGNSYGLKFSPKGDRLAFAYQLNLGGAGSQIGVIDFSSTAGRLSNILRIPINPGPSEFSPDGSKLYFISFNSLVQYDFETNTATTVTADSVNDLVLAPDKKIYLTYWRGKKTFAVVENPNGAGLSCGYHSAGLKLPAVAYGLPKFATILSPESSGKINAGRDTTVCVRQKVVLGSPENSSYNCQWSPPAYLNDIHSPMPEFIYPSALDSAATFTYLVKSVENNCSLRDIVQVTVNAPPKIAIHGSKSVCPGVTDVAYWATTMDPIALFNWMAVEGTLSSINGKDSVTISWRKTSNDASVNLNATDKFGCTGDYKFPLRINPVLQPDTPAGADSVCINLKENHKYQVSLTHGSEYTWGILNGEIAGGQLSNQVTVNWYDPNPHLVWVNEKSVTADTVCYGVSDTLRVTTFQDPARLMLNNVTLMPSDERTASIQVAIKENKFFNVGTLFRKGAAEMGWTAISNVHEVNEELYDANLQSGEEVYQYQLKGNSRCYAQIESLVHNTILLKGSNDEENNTISLHWNPYINWDGGVLRYEILRKVDQQDSFKIFARASGIDTAFNTGSGLDGFRHFFKVRAIRADSSAASLSNETIFEFDHELFIPNVITPNGDHLNDSFEIRNIRAYPQNELTIVNRYGSEVFHAFNYQGGWDGHELSTGVYYFVFKIPNQPAFRDWLQILK